MGAGDRVVGVVGQAGVVDGLDRGVGGEELGDALAGRVLALDPEVLMILNWPLASVSPMNTLLTRW